MPDVEQGGGLQREGGELSSSEDGARQRGMDSVSEEGDSGGGDEAAAAEMALSIVISQRGNAEALKAGTPKSIDGVVGEKNGSLVEMSAAKKGVLRSDSYHEECRVCQEQSDEPLMNLGCGCRGELAKAHLSCIGIWFRTKGSNKCEICQQVAINVPSPQSPPNTNYWIWRVDPAAVGSSNRGHGERRRGWFNPLWIAFCILVAGLLLDVLISVSFGVSALPVNIIIGVLIAMGLGTSLRLALECFREWNLQRIARRSAATSVDPPYHPDV